MFREWWKNHIFHQLDIKKVKGAYLSDFLTFDNTITANSKQQSGSGSIEGRVIHCL